MLFKRTIIAMLALGVMPVSHAQRADSVQTAGSTQDAYYNLNSGERTLIAHSDWDIAFTTKGYDPSILINEAKGVKLYVYSQDTADWSQVDTTGFAFNSPYWNSSESWQLGAFTAPGIGHPDYGWGSYESDHNLYGSRIFILDNGAGYLCQIMIDKLSVGGTWTFRVADIGGANSGIYSYAKGNYAEDNFFLFDVSSREVMDSEPASADWHLLFTKYMASVQGQAYPVSGVKINAGLQVAERLGLDIELDDTAGLYWNSNITEIGYDWKSFNMSTFSYDITPKLVYFVRNGIGDVWKIWFTGYSGGEFKFNIKKMASNASVAQFAPHRVDMYPNPASVQLRIANREAEHASVRILSMQGRVLETANVLPFETLEMNVQGLPSGLYLVEVLSEAKRSSYRIAIQ